MATLIARNLQAEKSKSVAGDVARVPPAAATPKPEPTEAEPSPDDLEVARQMLSSYSTAEVLRFVAENARSRTTSATLESFLSLGDDAVVREICCFVYAKGNAQKPCWPATQRAAVLTSRLKLVCPHAVGPMPDGAALPA